LKHEGNQFAEIAFTPSVRAVQTAMGSRDHYARTEAGEAYNCELGPDETRFIATRDTFYMASISETGWPYVQHRGGPPGFLKVMDPTTIGFADYRGNRQYVSVGNLSKVDRVALILVDYPQRARLKILGHARIVSEQEPEILAQLKMPDYRARVERAFVIRVAAFDWNCPQHITPRFTKVEVEAVIGSLQARILELEEKLRSSHAGSTPGK
jgi:predicted pyridoxine 5'-phosphate oxidase superfamily flavin-nucleotide-binding protein